MFYRIFISFLIGFTGLTLGWGQSITEKYTQEIIPISENEKMIISNHEMEGYTFSDTSYISVSRLLPPCDGGYTEIDGECYYQSDLDVLIDFTNIIIGVIEPLEFGTQTWEEGRLTSLSCTNCSLVGEIPISITNLDSLYGIFLGWNSQLTGEIPSGISDLINLKYINLEQNNHTGIILPEIGNLVNLEHLDLRGNQFTGGLSEDICNLTNLRYLLLDDNQLTGEIPECLGNLTNLRSLFLSRNQFSGEIPDSFSELINIEYLLLWNNQLSGEIPFGIYNLINLEKLRLYNNQFSGKLSENICDLTNLTWSTTQYFLFSGIFNNNLCPSYPECLVNQEPFTDVNENGIWDEGEPFEDTNNNGIYEEDYVGYQDTSECVEYQLGDVNQDSEVNVIDILIIVGFIMGTEESTDEQFILSDWNEDGFLNVVDILMIVDYILNN